MSLEKQPLTIFPCLILFIAALCLANNTYAHAGLEKTIPSANSTLAISPANLVLEFDNTVMLVKLALDDDNQKPPVNLAFKPSSTLMKTHTLTLPKLTDGHYTVKWSAMGKDGHAMNGSYVFMVDATTVQPAENPSAKGSQNKSLPSAPVTAPQESHGTHAH